MFSQKARNLPPFHVMEVLERAQELECSGQEIIHLEIGEPDFPTAPHICEAAMQAMRAGETKYTHSLGIPKLRSSVAEYYSREFNLELTSEQVIITSGTSPALLLLFMGLLERGDEVIMSNPYYACYPNFVEYLEGKPVFVYTSEEKGFSLEPKAVAEVLSSHTKAMLINSPCNPTGHVMHSRNLKALSEVAEKIPIISDEIYHGLVYKQPDHSILEFTDNAFVLNGFSKLYAMTGWRLGYLIAPQEYMRPLQKLQQNFFICANNFVQHAGIAALQGPQQYVKDMVNTYDKRRRYILIRLKDIGFGIEVEPEGAYYVLANAKEFGSDSLILSRSILEDAGVAVTPGIDFGDGAEGFIRFSYANSLDNIRKGMDRIEKYMNSRQNQKES
jgi:aspartate/methionine/tyrosine aminotransferase